MKIFKSLQVSIAFSTVFNNFASFGGSASWTPYKCIFPKFSKFFLNFRVNFDKILKKFSKTRKIFLKIFKKL